MHHYLLLVLSLVIAVSFLSIMAEKWRISAPIFLVIGGLALSLIPGMPTIQIDPEIVFLIILPPILYEAAWFTSWKEFWRWRRIISVLAFGFVLLTSTAVAFLSNALIPGFTLSLGFLLGAIISPPDAVAATSVLKGIKVPKAITSILEGESLVNDAASLIIFRFALVAVITNSFHFGEATGNFFLVTFLGIGIGLGIALIFYAIYRWMPTTPSIDIALSLVAPYIMYVAAEEVKVSGVMAVVSGGLFLSYYNHKFFSHTSRLQGIAMWSTVIFILNGLVFILIGLELPVVIEGIKDYSMYQALGFALAITVCIIIVRIVGALFAAGFTRVASRFITVADSSPGWKGPIIIGWAGMRGVVSLASALSIPLLMPDGKAFPHRELILFITFVVILITLVIQGLSLPAIIRLVKPELREKHQSAEAQENAIQTRLLEVSLKELEAFADKTGQNKLVKNKITMVKSEMERWQSLLSDETEVNKSHHEEYKKVVERLLKLRRETLYSFKKDTDFDDEVIRKVEAQLDLEEERRRRAMLD